MNHYQFNAYTEIPVPYAVFELIFNAAGDRVTDTRYVFVNARYCKMVGCRPEDLLGKRFMEVFPDSNDHWFDYCYQAVTQGKTCRDRIYEPLISHWLDFSVAPVSTPGCVAYTFALADREEELLAANKRDNLTGRTILRMSEILSGDENYESCMNHVLSELSQAVHPDRLYVVETDHVTATNTFEWCAPGVVPEIKTLQNLDYKDYLAGWEKYSVGRSCVIFTDISVLQKDDPINYENLKRQGIVRLIAAPFFQKNKLIGYLCADNYEENDKINTQYLLEMVSYFIGSKIINHRLIQKLEHMSRLDMLTQVHNRNAMIEDSDRIREGRGSVGVVYADINGLKKINDEEGHHAGDQAICFVAEILSGIFGKSYIHRAGGDEFVVLLPGITREEFDRKNMELERQLRDQNTYNIATGNAWNADAVDLTRTIRRADHLMYKNKAEYYIHHNRRGIKV